MKTSKKLQVNCSNPLRKLLVSLAVNCYVDCCKERAFDLSPDNIKAWLNYQSEDYTNTIYQELYEIQELPFTDYDFVEFGERHLEGEWKTEDFSKFIQFLILKFHKAAYNAT